MVGGHAGFEGVNEKFVDLLLRPCASGLVIFVAVDFVEVDVATTTRAVMRIHHAEDVAHLMQYYTSFVIGDGLVARDPTEIQGGLYLLESLARGTACIPISTI